MPHLQVGARRVQEVGHHLIVDLQEGHLAQELDLSGPRDGSGLAGSGPALLEADPGKQVLKNTGYEAAVRARPAAARGRQVTHHGVRLAGARLRKEGQCWRTEELKQRSTEANDIRGSDHVRAGTCLAVSEDGGVVSCEAVLHDGAANKAEEPLLQKGGTLFVSG